MMEARSSDDLDIALAAARQAVAALEEAVAQRDSQAPTFTPMALHPRRSPRRLIGAGELAKAYGLSKRVATRFCQHPGHGKKVLGRWHAFTDVAARELG